MPYATLVCIIISIHAPHEGERLNINASDINDIHFNPRSPRGGATSPLAAVGYGVQFQSTLPTRGSDSVQYLTAKVVCISIHAPHEGERRFVDDLGGPTAWISIHAPHEGERPALALVGVRVWANFNPRSPRGGATANLHISTADRHISIHAPHEGERRVRPHRCRLRSLISIHAPHEGERQRKSAFVCSISANLLNIIHCGTVTRAVSRRRIALFRLFSVRRSGVFTYAYASH